MLEQALVQVLVLEQALVQVLVLELVLAPGQVLVLVQERASVLRSQRPPGHLAGPLSLLKKITFYSI